MFDGRQHNSSSLRPLPTTLSPENPNYDTIVQRANQIQRQKDVELEILASTETLIDAGSGSTDPIPAPHAVTDFKRHLRGFQPRDYDALIEERNINHRCGYVLCPYPPRSEHTNAKFRILRGKARGEGAFRVVPREKLEQWCSETCARRALYIRAQLSEEPAWMRTEGSSANIVLLEEIEASRNPSAEMANLVEAVRNIELKEDKDQSLKALDTLSTERGERASSSKAAGVGEVIIHERSTISLDEPVPPRLDAGFHDNSEAVEGYQPQSVDEITEKLSRVLKYGKDSSH